MIEIIILVILLLNCAWMLKRLDDIKFELHEINNKTNKK